MRSPGFLRAGALASSADETAGNNSSIVIMRVGMRGFTRQ